MRQVAFRTLLVISLVSALAVTAACSRMPSDAATESSSEFATAVPVVRSFFDAAESGDGEALNRLFGPDMRLFRDADPVDSFDSIDIGEPFECDAVPRLGAGVAVGASSPTSDTATLIEVPVRLNVKKESPYLPTELGSLRLRVFLQESEAGWEIRSVQAADA